MTLGIVCSVTEQSLNLPTFPELEINDDFGIDFNPEVHSEEVQQEPEANGDVGSVVKAACVLRGPKTHGIVQMTQVDSGTTRISGTISGLFPLGNHGFHVHQYKVRQRLTRMSDKGCSSSTMVLHV